MNFGERLRSLRTQRNLTIIALAEQLGVSYSIVDKYERNDRRPSFDVLKAMKDLFNVNMDYLFAYTDEKMFSVSGLTPQQQADVDNMIMSYKKLNDSKHSATISDI